MRLLLWIYVNLKPLFKQFPITVLYIIGLPLLIGLLMGNMLDDLFQNPIQSEPLTLCIIDHDQTAYSQQLTDLFLNEPLSDSIHLTNEEASATLTIPRRYEEMILNHEEGELVLTANDKKNNAFLLSTLQQILDSYHEQLAMQLNSDKQEALNVLYEQGAIETKYVETPLSLTSQTYYSVSMIGFFVTLMIVTLTGAGAKSVELGTNKRLAAAPLKKETMFNYDFIGNFIYCFICLLLYTMVYRVLHYSFSGPFLLLLISVISTSFFIVSIGLFIQYTFSPKHGYLVAYTLFFWQIILGGTFLPNQVTELLSPTYYITHLFENYILSPTWQNIGGPLFMTTFIGLMFYLITFLKEKFFKKAV